jgi:MFS family permease
MSDRRFRTLQRKVSLYPLYQFLFNTFFWMPVFFLYFSAHLPLGRVLQLEAIYYAAVVGLEVPSGYLSDTVGRRATLLISTSALAASYLLFFIGPGLDGRAFEVFIAAQIFLAAGISFAARIGTRCWGGPRRPWPGGSRRRGTCGSPTACPCCRRWRCWWSSGCWPSRRPGPRSSRDPRCAAAFWGSSGRAWRSFPTGRWPG